MTSHAEDHSLLTGPDRIDLVRAALGVSDREALAVEVERVQARHDGLSVGYRVTQAAGSRHVMASTVPAALTSASVQLRDQAGLRRVALWEFPGDPQLPGLAVASRPDVVAGWLGQPVGLELVTYRAVRRAVIRVSGTRGTLAYLKIVRPGSAADLVARHEAVPGAPRLLGHPVPGVLVLQALAGETLTSRIAAGGRVPTLPDLLTASLTPPAGTLAPVEPTSARLADHVRALEARDLGSERGRVGGLATWAQESMAATRAPRPLVLTHGDLHGDNLLLDAQGRLCGVLDVDRSGPGHLLDDLACLLAHTEVSALMNDGAAGARLSAAARAWWRQATHPVLRCHTEPAVLAAHTAASILALAGVCPDGIVPSVLDLATDYLRRGQQRKDAS